MADIAASPPSARISTAIREFADRAGPASTIDTIVTFRSAEGLARLQALGVVRDRLTAVPMANAVLRPDQVATIVEWPEVRGIYPNERLRLYLDRSVPLIGADQAWAGRGLPKAITGAGVGVAIIDTGADGTHGDLPRDRKLKRNLAVTGADAIGPHDLVNHPILQRVPRDPAVKTPGATILVEGVQTDVEVGHGTHVASIVGGTGDASALRFRGVAPGASIFALRASAADRLLEWWILRAFEWIYLDVSKDLAEGRRPKIRVVNNSWGGGDGEDYDAEEPVNVMTKLLHDKDVVVVFAAGNSGGPDKLNRYAVSPHVVSVAAATLARAKASFSSTGRPGGDVIRDENGVYRPTVAAPGVDIMAARSSVGAELTALGAVATAQGGQGLDPNYPSYVHASGTSMAAPHVAGVVALMIEARPTLTAKELIDILEGTATDLPRFEGWEVGAGLVDALKAVQAAAEGKVAFPTPRALQPIRYRETRREPIEGVAPPAGYVLKDVDPSTVGRHRLEFKSRVDALVIEVGWNLQTDNLYLFLRDKQGNEVASSAGLLDTGTIRRRSLFVTNLEAGTYELTVEGRVNAPARYRGFAAVWEKSLAPPAPAAAGAKGARGAGTTP